MRRRRKKARRAIDEGTVRAYRGLIRHAVGSMHVGASYLAVMRMVRREAMRPGGWSQLTRNNRRALTAAVVREHRENRELYAWVMGGMSRGRRKARRSSSG
jgi:hypothetical protein